MPQLTCGHLLHYRGPSSMHLPIGAGWSSPVARQAHNLKVVGSNPTPATNVIEITLSARPASSAGLAAFRIAANSPLSPSSCAFASASQCTTTVSTKLCSALLARPQTSFSVNVTAKLSMSALSFAGWVSGSVIGVGMRCFRFACAGLSSHSSVLTRSIRDVRHSRPRPTLRGL